MKRYHLPTLILLASACLCSCHCIHSTEGEGETTTEGFHAEGQSTEGSAILEGAADGQGEGAPATEGGGEGTPEGEGQTTGGIDNTCTQCTYEVIAVYPHDRTAFTQGLDYDNGVLFEGTGLNGQSQLRRVDLATGQVLQHVSIAQQYFGEGIVAFGGDIFQITWQSKIGFVYDRNTFEKKRDVTYDTEGWGLTQNGADLIMSDGTANLYFRDPLTFAVKRTVPVTDANGPVRRLNEIEYVHGFVWANVWQTNRIVRIDPATGAVAGELILSGLLTPADMNPAVDVLNGIAYLPARDHLLVTGKLWPKLFEIAVKAAN